MSPMETATVRPGSELGAAQVKREEWYWDPGLIIAGPPDLVPEEQPVRTNPTSTGPRTTTPRKTAGLSTSSLQQHEAHAPRGEGPGARMISV
jgi:hypothetical protein